MGGVRFRCVDEGRREFLGGLATAGVAAVAGFAGCAAGLGGATAAGARPLTELDPQGFEILERPIVLAHGEILQNRSYLLSPRFENSSANAIIVVGGDAVRIRNVRIVGPADWQARWNDARPTARELPGVFGNSVGIRAHDVRDLTIERVSIEGLPRAAIAAWGLERAVIRDVQIRHCYHGINFGLNAASRWVRIERVRVSDLWGPPPESANSDPKANNPSRSRPGAWIGGDALALNSLRDSTLNDCMAVGEMFGAFKITNPLRVTVRGLRGSGFQVQGVAAGAEGDAMVPARDVLIEDCLFDKGLGYGRDLDGANCVQFTNHVASARMRRCVLNAAGMNGHGIQVTTDAHVRIESCTIRGFNGTRGPNPAHALDLAHGSSVNGDFAGINRFVDQQRILLDRNPPAAQ
jgi:hypothetical protein